jgi:hypothetical protein
MSVEAAKRRAVAVVLLGVRSGQRAETVASAAARQALGYVKVADLTPLEGAALARESWNVWVAGGGTGTPEAWAWVWLSEINHGGRGVVA